MTGMTIVDNFFLENMSVLQTYCLKNNFAEDFLMDSYLKIKEAVEVSGTTVRNWYGYTTRTIRNLWFDEMKSQKKKKTINMEPNYELEVQVEVSLEKEHDRNSEDLPMRNLLLYRTREIYKHIERCGEFDDKELFIIRGYFKDANMTYKELEARVGISINKCKKTVRKLRKVVRRDFKAWH